MTVSYGEPTMGWGEARPPVPPPMAAHAHHGAPRAHEGLTASELHVVGLLRDATTAFAGCVDAGSEVDEFAFHVRALERIVMARAAQRAHPDIFGQVGAPSYRGQQVRDPGGR